MYFFIRWRYAEHREVAASETFDGVASRGEDPQGAAIGACRVIFDRRDGTILDVGIDSCSVAWKSGEFLSVPGQDPISLKVFHSRQHFHQWPISRCRVV